MPPLIALVLFSVSSLTSACIYSRSEGQHWGYDGAIGPVMWHSLSPDNSACGMGKNQSPINVNSAISLIDGSRFDFPTYGDFKLSNNGHTIQGEPVEEEAEEFFSSLGGHEYQLKNFHFHTPSEHTLNGVGYPLEAHFVHQDPESMFRNAHRRERKTIMLTIGFS
jgi:carbonic anhydrase